MNYNVSKGFTHIFHKMRTKLDPMESDVLSTLVIYAQFEDVWQVMELHQTFQCIQLHKTTCPHEKVYATINHQKKQQWRDLSQRVKVARGTLQSRITFEVITGNLRLFDLSTGFGILSDASISSLRFIFAARSSSREQSSSTSFTEWHSVTSIVSHNQYFVKFEQYLSIKQRKNKERREEAERALDSGYFCWQQWTPHWIQSRADTNS